MDPAAPVTVLNANLNFGADLVLNTASGSPPSPGSTLNISQGGSPP
jgi:hypothetical protein